MTTATSNFLIPNATFFVELVAFIIVLAVLGKYVLPILNSALAERQKKIGDELEAADRARADASAADDERREALEQARHHAREIVAQANRTADQVKSDAEGRGQDEFDRILTSANAEVELARRRAVDEASQHMGEMVLDVVERVIGREVDAEAHRDLVDEAISAVTADSTSPGTEASPAGAGA